MEVPLDGMWVCLKEIKLKSCIVMSISCGIKWGYPWYPFNYQTTPTGHTVFFFFFTFLGNTSKIFEVVDDDSVIQAPRYHQQPRKKKVGPGPGWSPWNPVTHLSAITWGFDLTKNAARHVQSTLGCWVVSTRPKHQSLQKWTLPKTWSLSWTRNQRTMSVLSVVPSSQTKPDSSSRLQISDVPEKPIRWPQKWRR